MYKTKASSVIKFQLIALFILILILRVQSQTDVVNKDLPFMNADLPLQERVDDLVSRLTPEEKILQMQHTSPAILRLGIPQYNWWNECLHGVARNGIATVFPQAIGMAATFNPELVCREADIISTEARAKYYEAVSKNSREIYQGLTFWSPNINIFRDPRWGRGQETYGEDPFLTAQTGIAFVKGLQGNDPDYFKVIATAKHFAVHSGPESQRHKFDAWVSESDLYDTYLPAFEALVREAKVYSVMGAYNRLYSIPCCASDFLLNRTLRQTWGFKGYVVSDCWAVSDIYTFHNVVPDAAKAATLALKAGCDLVCGVEYGQLSEALKLGYISEKELDVPVKRLFEARFRLGLFDPPVKVKYSSIPANAYDTEEHRSLAREAARQSIVLLTNENSTLPLSHKTKNIAVIGPYANDTSVLLGNYNGIPSRPVTILDGICNKVSRNSRVVYCLGAEKPETYARHAGTGNPEAKALIEEALQVTRKADVIIFAGGISPNLEGEEMDVEVPGFLKGDRTTLDLPENQLELLELLKKTGKPVILVLTNGSALSINQAVQNTQAVIEAWYPGEEGGNALADVIFGDYNPAGRLPVTFYKSVNDLPAFDDYSMKGRTYRYFNGDVLFPFGYGLSYSTYRYEQVKTNQAEYSKNDTVFVSVKVSNSGMYSGDEVIQLYVKQPENSKDQPIKSLTAFERVYFGKGESKTVLLTIPVSRLRHYSPENSGYAIAEGNYQLLIGASSSDIRLKSDIIIK